MGKENKSKYESTSDYGSKIDDEENTFQIHNNYGHYEQYTNEEDGVIEDWEWEPVTDDMEIPDIPDIYDVTHGLKEGVEKTFATTLE